MDITRRDCLKGLAAAGAAASLAGSFGSAFAAEGGQRAVHIVRFTAPGLGLPAGAGAYGILDGERVKELRSPPFDGLVESGRSFDRKEVKLLVPCEPSKVLALAGNYQSHIGDQPIAKNPEVFIKAPSALLEAEGTIVLPKGSKDVHYEGELVVVIGKRAKNVSRERALEHVLGYACGNDVSARDWQKDDRQWWRAKAADTFAPLGPTIVQGIDAGDLLLTTRVNGKELQRCRTKELIFDVPTVVSFISEHMTLLPGDAIYTGTSGKTTALQPGDTVEIEIEKIGVLRNRVGGPA